MEVLKISSRFLFDNNIDNTNNEITKLFSKAQSYDQQSLGLFRPFMKAMNNKPNLDIKEGIVFDNSNNESLVSGNDLADGSWFYRDNTTTDLMYCLQLWHKPTSEDTNQYFLHMSGYSNSNYILLLYNWSGGTTERYTFAQGSGNNVIVGTYPINQWNHICVIGIEGVHYFLINGILVGTNNMLSDLNYLIPVLYLGRQSGTTPNYCDCCIDEVEVYIFDIPYNPIGYSLGDRVFHPKLRAANIGIPQKNLVDLNAKRGTVTSGSDIISVTGNNSLHFLKQSELSNAPSLENDTWVFDGSNDEFLISEAKKLYPFGDFTIVMNFYLDSTYADSIQGIFEIWDGANNSNYSMIFTVRHDVSVGRVEFVIQSSTDSNQTLAFVFSMDTDYEIVLMRHKDLFYLIVNGTLKAVEDEAGATLNWITKGDNTYTMLCGKDRANTNRYFSGGIRYIRYVNHAIFELTNDPLLSYRTDYNVDDSIYNGNLENADLNKVYIKE